MVVVNVVVVECLVTGHIAWTSQASCQYWPSPNLQTYTNNPQGQKSSALSHASTHTAPRCFPVRTKRLYRTIAPTPPRCNLTADVRGTPPHSPTNRNVRHFWLQ
ncbi:hypothetical protein BU16DRAFT_261335 [Lophium mytilinum]|uniref:Secreted protein n=1 Tax=Lophium mytilinum TaxID=390894 RepID=A0A6A6R4A5_9PEZI|nr:hypothetical protein BU16DRAFT_261335 [Lophium mytilinum]